MTPSMLESARAHAAECYPAEAAGVVIEVNGKAEYRPCRNLGTEPDVFILDPDDSAAAEDEGRLLGYIHSHPGGPVTPSEADRAGCDRSGLPWWVIEYPGEAWTRLDPVGRKLEGRQFVLGVDDCFSLVRDWYAATLCNLPDFERVEKFWERGLTPHLDHMEAAGFYEVHREDLQSEDVILFKVAAKTTNHCAVYLGSGMMLHHLPGQLSLAEQIDGKWQARITHVVRHP